MEKLHNLMDAICSFENLYAAYQEAAKGKRYRDEVIAFTQNLEENLIQLQRELMGWYYKVGPYREFYVNFPKSRLVMALGFRDRIVQWAVYRQLNPYMDKRFIQHSYGCRKEKGTLAAAECLLNWIQKVSRQPDADQWVIVKGDISKYFYRVDHEKALDMYSEITDDLWFMWLMCVIIDNPEIPFGLPPGSNIADCPRRERLYDVGMPIGNLSSQETANIYLDKLDQYCKHVLKVHYYVRYMDDFILLVKGKEEAERLFAAIADFLKSELRLDVSPKSKIIPLIRGCEFVGYRVTPYGLRLRKKTTQHIKDSLRHVAKLYADGIIDLDHALQTVNSYFGMTKHCNGANLCRWIEENYVLCRKSPEDTPVVNDSIWLSAYDEEGMVAA